MQPAMPKRRPQPPPCLSLSPSLRAIRACRGGLQLLSLLLHQLAAKWQANGESPLGGTPEQPSSRCSMGEGTMNDVGRALRPPSGTKPHTSDVTICWMEYMRGKAKFVLPSKQWQDLLMSNRTIIRYVWSRGNTNTRYLFRSFFVLQYKMSHSEYPSFLVFDEKQCKQVDNWGQTSSSILLGLYVTVGKFVFLLLLIETS